jgi:predicted SAM-dependent methyltransferase
MPHFNQLCKLCRRRRYSQGQCSISAECTQNPKLNLGSGIVPYEQYINFDAGVFRGIQKWDGHLQTDIVGKIEDLLEIFPHGYFAEIISAQVIEHFFFEDALEFLSNQLLLLRPGGKIVVEGPCILGVFRWYQEGRFPRGVRSLIDYLYPYHNRVAREHHGELQQHKSGWTGQVLSEEMEKLWIKVTHVGEGQTAGCAWRDFRVEGIKA